jgi:putative selenium metabolism hydrolase
MKMHALQADICKNAVKLEKKSVKFLRKLIAIRSESCFEKRAVELCASEMNALKFDEVFVDKFGNVVGKIGDGRKYILYDSHIDTVGTGDLTSWKFDPLKGLYKNNIIFGRGAVDNKGAIASMIYAGKIISNIDIANKICIVIAGIVQEEACEGLAVKHLIYELSRKPVAVLLGEATNLAIHHGHRGRAEIQAVVRGKACHASVPQSGVNAIYRMQRVIASIEKLNRSLKSDKILGKGSIAVTNIECKTASVNTIPDECTIYIDRRTVRDESANLILNQIKAFSKHLNARIVCYNAKSHTNFDCSAKKYFPAWVLPRNHPVLQAAIQTYRTIFKKMPLVSTWKFCTDGSYTYGIAKIPTVGFGPGDEKYAHTSDEQVPVEHIVKCMMFYSMFPKTIEKLIEKNRGV